MCKKCAVKELIKDVLLKVILPLAVAYFLYYMAGLAFKGNTNQTIFTIMLVGFPFGARKMFLWLIPTGHGSIAISAAILLLNVFVGALIGWALLAWRVVSTAIKTVYRLIKIVLYRPYPIPILDE
jgi:hypothetical protein